MRGDVETGSGGAKPPSPLLFLNPTLAPILHHSSPCSLHLSVWHVRAAATIQLGFPSPSLHPPVVCLLHSFIPAVVPSSSSPPTHSRLFYVTARFLQPAAQFILLRISLVPAFFSPDMFLIREPPLPSPHSIVSCFLCTLPCFLQPSKFRPGQDIAKTYRVPSMMSWLSRVCPGVGVRARCCLFLFTPVYVSQKPCVFLCGRRQPIHARCGLFDDKSYLFHWRKHPPTQCAGEQGRSSLGLSDCPLR